MEHASDADLLVMGAARRFDNALVLRNGRPAAEDGTQKRGRMRSQKAGWPPGRAVQLSKASHCNPKPDGLADVVHGSLGPVAVAVRVTNLEMQQEEGVGGQSSRFTSHVSTCLVIRLAGIMPVFLHVIVAEPVRKGLIAGEPDKLRRPGLVTLGRLHRRCSNLTGIRSRFTQCRARPK